MWPSWWCAIREKNALLKDGNKSDRNLRAGYCLDLPSLSDSFFVWAALARFRHIAVSHSHDFFNAPNMIAEASGHRGRDPERLVDACKIVVHGMDCYHRRVIF